MLDYFAYKRFAVAAKYTPTEEWDRVIEIESTYKSVPVKAIREDCFCEARRIGLCTFPSTLSEIGERAFKNSSITSVVTRGTPEEVHVSEIHSEAFKGSNLTYVKLVCNGLLVIGSEAFSNCQLEEIEIIGKGEVKIGESAFRNAKKLRVFRCMEPKLSFLPESSFEACKSLHTLAIPSLSRVGKRALAGCSELAGFNRYLQSFYPDSFEGCDKIKLPSVQKKRRSTWEEDTIVLPSPEEIQAMLESNEPNIPGVPFKSFHETYRDCKPLLSLAITPKSESERPNLRHPIIKGYFRTDLIQKNTFHFEVTVPRGYENISLITVCEKKFNPLLTYLANGSTIVQLTGMESENGDLFNVFEIEPSLGNNTVCTPEFFREIMARLSGRPRTSFSISTAAQARLFLELMADTGIISADIIRAIRQELADLERQPSDILKHRLEAIKVLTTLDLFPTAKLEGPPLDVAKTTLNRELGGMKRAKQAILQAIAALHQGHMPARRGILFVGPPGTGKTKISQLCAKLLASSPNGLPTIDLDFSSMHSPIDLTGSERDYSNGTYSILVRKALQTPTRAMRACVHLGEVDKGSLELQHTLLGMLDGRFFDVYLSIPIHTEQLFFLMTANSLDSLPPPLLSRLHIVHVDSYTREEKHQILRDILIPEANANNNLTPGFQFQAAAEQLLLDYTDKAGIRELKGAISDIVDYYHLESEEHGEHQLKRVYTVNDIKQILPSVTTYRPNYDSAPPGEVRFLYANEITGEPQIGVVQVSFALSDTPSVEFFGPVGMQRDHLYMAIAAIKACTSFSLGELNLYVALPEPIQSQQNVLGLPVFLAIHSALREEPIAPGTLLVGSGIDLYANGFLPKGPMTSLLKTAMDLDATVVVAPTGFTDRIDSVDLLDRTPLIIESTIGGELVRFLLKN